MKRLPALWLTGLGFFGGALAFATASTQDTFVNSIGMKLVRIKSGVFTMGSESAVIPLAEGRVKSVDYDEQLAHRVTIRPVVSDGCLPEPCLTHSSLEAVRKVRASTANKVPRSRPLLFSRESAITIFLQALSFSKGNITDLRVQRRVYGCIL
ncbi:MAG: hypothetical protein ACYTEQ_17575 [Planctomycetota bacterium]|jgi:hypothetical protein